MSAERFTEHLQFPQGKGLRPAGASIGAAGGAVCGDLVSIALRVEGASVVAAGFEASGCGAVTAAGSAAAALVEGASLLDAARVGTHQIAAELGGLSPGKLHAAELAADALHRALGTAARAAAALAPDPWRTLVAMSGGVDSAVAALLCARAGGDAVAVTLELWADDAASPGGSSPASPRAAEASCCSAHAVRVARSLAHGMGLPHFTLDLREEFRAGVVTPWLDEHAAGLTPNPCVRCNGHVRLDAMLDFAGRLGAAELATGHYARRSSEGLLRSAADPAKDQAYMLCALRPATIARLRFPLGELTKPEVRALAAEAELPVASKADSQDLCFLAGTGRAAFLARHGGARERPGEIVDRGGRVLGRHRGHHGFTVGQRKGIGLAAPEPLYVLATDARTNRVTVGARADLLTWEVEVRGARLHRVVGEVDSVRLRYRSRPLPCTVVEHGRGRVTLRLHEPVDGAAPGQTACFYSGDVVVGSGTIA